MTDLEPQDLRSYLADAAYDAHYGRDTSARRTAEDVAEARPDIAREFVRITARLETLVRDAECPVAQFERLSGHALGLHPLAGDAR